MIAPDYLIFTNTTLSRRIFYHVSQKDLNNCALVNKTWHAAVQDARENRTLKITADLVRQIYKNSTFDTYLKDNHTLTPNVVINGWAPKNLVTEKTYESLLKSCLRAKNLTLKGRGSWLTCKCPRKGSTSGEQFDTIAKDDITILESITVGHTFKISACALLDLVSRCPRLKMLRFFGTLEKCDHTELFNLKAFLSDLDRLDWPMIKKAHFPTVKILVKRNENISTFYSNGDLTCELFQADALGNLKYLSLFLNEKWIDLPSDENNIKKYLKRAQQFTRNIKCLSLGAKIEALEVRTFNIPYDDEPDNPSDLRLKLDPLHEQYKLTFWEQVAKLPNLKYLSVNGAWELNAVCRELAKHDCKIEFLRLAIQPASLQAALAAQEDSPTLAMVDEARNLKKLPKLRSLWFSCYEKLGSIDEKTVQMLNNSLIDLIWTLDIKVMFTEEVEQLLNAIMRRGNQLGKTYKFSLHIQNRNPEYADVLSEHNLKFPMGTELRQKLAQVAEMEMSERDGNVESFQIWGLRQIDNSRDRTTFEKLKNTWLHYESLFSLTSPWRKLA